MSDTDNGMMEVTIAAGSDYKSFVIFQSATNTYMLIGKSEKGMMCRVYAYTKEEARNLWERLIGEGFKKYDLIKSEDRDVKPEIKDKTIAEQLEEMMKDSEVIKKMNPNPWVPSWPNNQPYQPNRITIGTGTNSPYSGTINAGGGTYIAKVTNVAKTDAANSDIIVDSSSYNNIPF